MSVIGGVDWLNVMRSTSLFVHPIDDYHASKCDILPAWFPPKQVKLLLCPVCHRPNYIAEKALPSSRQHVVALQDQCPIIHIIPKRDINPLSYTAPTRDRGLNHEDDCDCRLAARSCRSPVSATWTRPPECSSAFLGPLATASSIWSFTFSASASVVAPRSVFVAPWLLFVAVVAVADVSDARIFL